ncbi:sulfatase-like hydrolase/transferase [Winogradskyella wandonensis]|uniref:sulfatase-like hydrolase/transferase n=1 Tax=Winogradskyella wandonensis TaxID=1442586 RepID=UPI001304B6B1|nr:sulfatase-like hydrolase/transferase [Winogradskyella wandonensis]
MILVKLSFYYNYRERLSASAFYTIFETYDSEVVTFLGTYFTAEILVLAFILFLPLFILVGLKQFGLSVKSELRKNVSMAMRVVFSVGLVFSVYLIITRLQNVNTFVISYNSYRDYNSYLDLSKDNLSNKTTDLLTNVNQVHEPQTHIVVIGESTTKHHMQLYGYPRQTNPLLSQIKNELSIFNNVISPHVHTILSLDKILTLSDYNNAERNPNASIVQLANMAGYRTYWVSNQRKIGIYETLPSVIANAADESYFLNNENSDAQIYDGKLLPVVNNILQDNNEKRIIFVHLIGTHGNYIKRYPERFNYFKNEDYPSEDKSSKAKKTINAYDNAIRYNDFIIASLIKSLKKQTSKSSLVYFSDHGDDVYVTTNKNLGHNEYLWTKPMYEVPFIYWQSEKNKVQNKNYTSRPYILDEFIHSFADITNIRFSEFEPKKSVFNASFMPKRRLIKYQIDYDAN